MKSYTKKILITAVFGIFVFFAAIPEASAFIGLNIGFGSMSSYGYGYGANNFGNMMMPNYYGSYYGGGYNNFGYGNSYMPFYTNNYGYNNYSSYGYNSGYYNPGGYYNDFNPVPTPGYYTSNRMYSTWYGY